MVVELWLEAKWIFNGSCGSRWRTSDDKRGWQWIRLLEEADQGGEAS